VTDLKPVTVLRGVGDGLASRLHALGVETTQDLLFLLPMRYEDRTRVAPLGELKPGQRAAVEGEVLLTEIAFRGRRQMLCRIGDGSGFLTLRFFYFTTQQHNALARGVRVRCFGEARRGPGGMEMVHPEYRRVLGAASVATEPPMGSSRRLPPRGGAPAACRCPRTSSTIRITWPKDSSASRSVNLSCSWGHGARMTKSR